MKNKKRILAIGLVVMMFVACFAGCNKDTESNSSTVDVSSNDATAEEASPITDEVAEQLPEIDYDYRVYGERDSENPGIFTEDYFGFKYELDPSLGLTAWEETDLAMISGLTTYDTEQLAAIIGFDGIGTVYYADTLDGSQSIKISITKNNGSDARTLLNWFITQGYYTDKLEWYGVNEYEAIGSAAEVPRTSSGTFPVAETVVSGTAEHEGNVSYNEILIVFPTQKYAAFIEITSLESDMTESILSGLSLTADSIPVENLSVQGELPTLSKKSVNEANVINNPYTVIGDYNSVTISQDKFDELCSRYNIIPTKSQTGEDLEWYGNNEEVSFTYAKCVQQITLSDYLAYFYSMLSSSSDQPLCEMYMDETELARYAVLNDGEDEFFLIGAKNIDTFKSLIEEFGVSFEYDEQIAADNMQKNAELYSAYNEATDQ